MTIGKLFPLSLALFSVNAMGHTFDVFDNWRVWSYTNSVSMHAKNRSGYRLTYTCSRRDGAFVCFGMLDVKRRCRNGYRAKLTMATEGNSEVGVAACLAGYRSVGERYIFVADILQDIIPQTRYDGEIGLSFYLKNGDLKETGFPAKGVHRAFARVEELIERRLNEAR